MRFSPVFFEAGRTPPLDAPEKRLSQGALESIARMARSIALLISPGQNSDSSPFAGCPHAGPTTPRGDASSSSSRLASYPALSPSKYRDRRLALSRAAQPSHTAARCKALSQTQRAQETPSQAPAAAGPLPALCRTSKFPLSRKAPKARLFPKGQDLLEKAQKGAGKSPFPPPFCAFLLRAGPARSKKGAHPCMRPDIPLFLRASSSWTPSKKDFYSSLSLTIISISTARFMGSCGTGMAERAWRPASPKTSTSRSEAPLMTLGWS